MTTIQEKVPQIRIALQSQLAACLQRYGVTVHSRAYGCAAAEMLADIERGNCAIDPYAAILVFNKLPPRRPSSDTTITATLEELQTYNALSVRLYALGKVGKRNMGLPPSRGTTANIALIYIGMKAQTENTP